MSVYLVPERMLPTLSELDERRVKRECQRLFPDELGVVRLRMHDAFGRLFGTKEKRILAKISTRFLHE